MLDAPLHAGTEHPTLVWILVASVLSFVLGVGVASYAAAVRERLSPSTDPSAD